jgi:GMP synthase-like glutamine amidotransferase
MNRVPRLLVFQHIDVEHPGIFREFLAADRIAWDMVELDRGEPIPDLEAYNGLWVMGGPMDVWEESDNPWLVAEKQAIKRAVVDLNLGYMGICLGHQLLASALGGEVGKGTSEVGVMPVELTADGRASTYFEGLPSTLDCLQWHGAEVMGVPEGARVLARSEKCAVQSMSIGEKAFSAQFHVEVTPATVPEWAAVPTYAQALDEALGVGALDGFQSAVYGAMAEFNSCAKKLYDNWMRATGLIVQRASVESA